MRDHIDSRDLKGIFLVDYTGRVSLTMAFQRNPSCTLSLTVHLHATMLSKAHGRPMRLKRKFHFFLFKTS